MAIGDDKVAEKVQRELQRFQSIDDANIDEVIKTLLGIPKGQIFLWWLLQISKVGVQPFTPDPYQTAFNSGELNVGNRLLARLIDVNPQGYVDMQIARKLEDDRRTQYADRLARGDDLYADAEHADSSPGDLDYPGS